MLLQLLLAGQHLRVPCLQTAAPAVEALSEAAAADGEGSTVWRSVRRRGRVPAPAAPKAGAAAAADRLELGSQQEGGTSACGSVRGGGTGG